MAFYNNVEAAFYQCSFGRSSRKKPGYVKFMKDLVTKKRSVTFEDDDRMQHCSAIATRISGPKERRSGCVHYSLYNRAIIFWEGIM